MSEELWRYGFPILMGMVFASFTWAWILSAVKPPEVSEEKRNAGKVNLHWTYLDSGPEGTPIQNTREIQPQAKPVGT